MTIKHYQQGWIFNEKGCAIHNKLARDFGKILPLWGDDSTFPPTDVLDRTIENSGLPEKVVKALKGKIGRTEDGRIVARLSPKGGMEELKMNVHKIYGKAKLPVWTRWFPFFLFCARLRLLMVFGLVSILRSVLRAPQTTNKHQLPTPYYNKTEDEGAFFLLSRLPELNDCLARPQVGVFAFGPSCPPAKASTESTIDTDDSLFLLFAAFFTPEFASPAEMHNRRQLKEDGPPRSLAELEAAHKEDVASALARLGNKELIKKEALAEFPWRESFTAKEEELV